MCVLEGSLVEYAAPCTSKLNLPEPKWPGITWGTYGEENITRFKHSIR